ncbi:MAG: type II secretion system protein GspG [Acidobacteria bacterium]|nr:type II secretion system protein GspG [Acidobacteriota bacterium]
MLRSLSPLLFVITIATYAQPPAGSDCQATGQTMRDLRNLQTTVEAYYADYKRYPDAVSIAQLQPIVSPIYIRPFPTTDAWGTELLYRTFADGKAYVIASAGSDKQFDERTWQKGPRNASEDAVIRSGQELKMWEECK